MKRIALNTFVPIETRSPVYALQDGCFGVLQDGVVQVHKMCVGLLNELVLPETYQGYGNFKAVGSHINHRANTSRIILLGHSTKKGSKDAAFFVVEYKNSSLTLMLGTVVPNMVRLISVGSGIAFVETDEYLYMGVSLSSALGKFESLRICDKFRKSHKKDCTRLMQKGIACISRRLGELHIALKDGGVLSYPREENMSFRTHLYGKDTPEGRVFSNRLAEEPYVQLLAMSGSLSAHRVEFENLQVYDAKSRDYFFPDKLTPSEKDRNELVLSVPVDNIYAPHCLIAARHLFVIDDCYWTLRNDPTRKDLPVAKRRLLEVYALDGTLRGNLIEAIDLLPDTANTAIYGVVNLSDTFCARIGVHTAKGLYVYGVNQGA
jgi:hypothetical protein